jgi:nucleoside-diphosphate-sugar epimerase
MGVIAITGSSSYIGVNLVDHLARCEDDTLHLLEHRKRLAGRQDNGQVKIARGDLLESGSLEDFLEQGCTVVNLAYLAGDSLERNMAAIDNLIEACTRARVRRLVHCSTAVVAGRVPVDRVTEDTPVNPLLPYEMTKNAMEKRLLRRSAGRFERVILRPTAVFGNGGRNLVTLAVDLQTGSRARNYLRSCIYQRRRMNLVCIGTVVSAIAFLVKTPRTVDGEIFIVSDDEHPSNNFRDVETFLMKELGCRAYQVPPVSVPFFVLKSLLRAAGRTNLNPNLVYDGRKILAFGFEKQLTFSEGLSLFSEWYRQKT